MIARDTGPPREPREGWVTLALGRGLRVPILDEEALDRIDAGLTRARDSGIRAIVITGGDRVFAAGADLKRVRSLDPWSARAFSRHGQRILGRIETFPGVVIAQVTGRCFGGAFDLALACDIRIAGPRATFEHPGPRLGFLTGYGGTDRLGRAHPGIATGLVAGRTMLDADEALRAGLVAEVHPEDRIDAAVVGLAQRCAGASKDRIVAVKECIRRFGHHAGGARIERALARGRASVS